MCVCIESYSFILFYVYELVGQLILSKHFQFNEKTYQVPIFSFQPTFLQLFVPN